MVSPRDIEPKRWLQIAAVALVIALLGLFFALLGMNVIGSIILAFLVILLVGGIALGWNKFQGYQFPDKAASDNTPPTTHDPWAPTSSDSMTDTTVLPRVEATSVQPPPTGLLAARLQPTASATSPSNAQGQTPTPGDTGQKGMMKYASLIWAALALLVGGLVALVTGWSPTYMLILSLIIAMVGAVVIRGIMDEHKDSEPAAWTEKVEPLHDWLPPGHFKRLKRFLASSVTSGNTEDRVYIVLRFHWVKLISLCGPWFLACVMSLITAGVATGSTGWSINLVDYSGNKRHIVVQSWGTALFFLLVAAIFALITWIRSWYWSYTYIMITGRRIVKITAPPPIKAYFMNTKAPDVRLDKIDSGNPSKFGFFNFFGVNVGKIGLDSAAQTGDLPFNDIEPVGNPFEVNAVLQAAILDNRNTGEQDIITKLELILNQLQHNDGSSQAVIALMQEQLASAQRKTNDPQGDS